MTDLDKLIEAVEAGATISWGLGGSPSRKALPMHWHDAMNAYVGSLDAALRLHEALLPGTPWTVFDLGIAVVGSRNVADMGAQQGVLSDPARAWLLAILRALKAKGDA